MLGITSAPGSPLQLMQVGIGPAALLGLPWSLVPTVVVPFYLIMHGVIGLQLRQRATKARQTAGPAVTSMRGRKPPALSPPYSPC
jgi:hypothetical protein